MYYPDFIEAETEAPRISLEKLNPDSRGVVIIWEVKRDWLAGSIKRVQHREQARHRGTLWTSDSGTDRGVPGDRKREESQRLREPGRRAVGQPSPGARLETMASNPVDFLGQHFGGGQPFSG